MIAKLHKRRNLADAVLRLGQIPLDRIRMDPPPGRAVADDIERIRLHDDVLCELVDDVLVEKPMGLEESLVAMELATAIKNWLKPLRLGIVAGPDGGWALALRLIRMPDVSFVSFETLRRYQVPRTAYPAIPPDLAVEILSLSNTRQEMERKRQEYFAAGTRSVWEIDPRQRIARMYSDCDSFVEIDENGLLDGGEVLPGFSIQLRELFVDLDEYQKTKS